LVVKIVRVVNQFFFRPFHYLAAISLFTLIIFQKYTVIKLTQNYATWKATHKWVGTSVLLLVFGMDMGGYLMGFYSSMHNFTLFNFFFALPWVIWIVGIYFTASIKNVQWHKFMSNMLLKGCLAVPCSRLTGATLQKWGWEESAGYYKGIGAASVVVTMWQFYDIYHLYRDMYWNVPNKSKQH